VKKIRGKFKCRLNRQCIRKTMMSFNNIQSNNKLLIISTHLSHIQNFVKRENILKIPLLHKEHSISKMAMLYFKNINIDKPREQLLPEICCICLRFTLLKIIWNITFHLSMVKEPKQALHYLLQMNLIKASVLVQN
jgi:hypothetical protein